MINIVYSEKYLDYGFGESHPFRPERARKFIELLETKKLGYKIIEAPRASDEEILLVHTEEYLERVKHLSKEAGGVSMDTPVTKENLEAAYYYTGGTIRAAEIALEGKKVVNLLGGLHHAESNNSSGFCIFNDHAIAIRSLQKNDKIKTASVLDLDVHAGNGTQEIFYDDPTVLTISVHQDPTRFYPGTGFEHQTGEGEGEGFNINKVLSPGTKEKEYLEFLDALLPVVVDFEPDILLVILGVDTYEKDPLASVKLEKGTYAKIAGRIKKFDKKAVLFAGGYSKDVPELWWNFVSNL